MKQKLCFLLNSSRRKEIIVIGINKDSKIYSCTRNRSSRYIITKSVEDSLNYYQITNFTKGTNAKHTAIIDTIYPRYFFLFILNIYALA